MKPPRIFVDAPVAPGAEIRLDPQDAHHVRDVLRMHRGDPLVLVCNRVAWDARVTNITQDLAMITVLQQATQPSTELPTDLIVLQALPKGAKMDRVIEKVVELGATRIVPVRSARSLGSDSPAKLSRWRRIARAAAQQAQRMIVPAVDEPKNFQTAIEQFASAAHIIVASELARPGSLRVAVEREPQQAIAIAIGPEGSFTEEELRWAVDTGCDVASLGPMILRTETAAPAMIAAIAALRHWW